MVAEHLSRKCVVTICINPKTSEANFSSLNSLIQSVFYIKLYFTRFENDLRNQKKREKRLQIWDFNGDGSATSVM